jgi:hypothetical protein
VLGVAVDCDDTVYLLSLWRFRTAGYGLLITVPCGTVTVKRIKRKISARSSGGVCGGRVEFIRGGEVW